MDKFEKATFAGGCFWCVEKAFDEVEGVLFTTVGYTHGETDNPSYSEVCSGKTGHIEAVEVLFDPEKITYDELLEIFWHNIDPTVQNKQFCDIGRQYQTVIFVHSDEQRQKAERSRSLVQEKLDDMQTEIHPATTFHPAEEYHQKYYQKNSERYQAYHDASKRDERLREIWKK